MSDRPSLDRLADEDLAALKREIEERLARSGPARWSTDSERVEKSVAQLVLTLVELIRQLMERQAIRRMEEGTLDPAEVEAVGTALMKIEETVHELASRFDLTPDDLTLDLGPLGRLL